MLFICIGNTCRSPMAEAIARGLGEGKVEAYSAGLAPTGRVSDKAERALEELGYSAEGLRSNGFDQVPLADMDVVVSLIGIDGLRFLPRNLPAEIVQWSVRDPIGEDEETFVAVAKLLESKLRKLVSGHLGSQ